MWADHASIRVGISSCLLGEQVRWDGGHKRDRFLTDVLDDYVEWVPVCPEFEVGMGIPREPVRLVSSGRSTRMIGVDTKHDWTAEMRTWARRRVRDLRAMDLCGFVFKKGSPSCGMERVKVYVKSGHPARQGSGLFASELMERFTNLPVEEEGRLNDAKLRENFIERLFAYRRLLSLFEGRWRIGGLVAFHTRHKLQLLAHSPKGYERLGRLVARSKGMTRAEVRAKYENLFMAALAEKATRPRHVNVLQHCIGYFRKELDGVARAELQEVVNDYRAGVVPLVVPVTMVAHYVRMLSVEYLADQVYLQPHPKELMLRNHA